jgi:hypothetical protein
MRNDEVIERLKVLHTRRGFNGDFASARNGFVLFF